MLNVNLGTPGFTCGHDTIDQLVTTPNDLGGRLLTSIFRLFSKFHRE